jgi:hypothetical protein
LTRRKEKNEENKRKRIFCSKKEYWKRKGGKVSAYTK